MWTTEKLKSASLAWLVLNLFLVPSLASIGGDVGEAYQVLEGTANTIGAFGAIDAVGAGIPVEMFSSGNTVAVVNNAFWTYLVYAIVLIGFLALIMWAPVETGFAKSAFVLGMMIALPVYSSKVMGDTTIPGITVVGQKGIPGYVEPADTMHIWVNITMVGETNMTKDQVAVQLGSETMFFNQCKGNNETLGCLQGADNDSWICECVNMLGSPQNPLTNPVNSLQFLVFTKNNKITPAAYKQEKVYMDNKGPHVNRFEAEQIKDKIQFTIDASDGNVAQKCAGINNIEFYMGETKLSGATLTVNQDPGNCSLYSNTFNTSVSKSGNTTFSVVVTDNLGNKGNDTTDSMILDFKAPVVDDNFKVYQGSKEIEYMSTIGPTSGLRNSRIVFYIEEANLKSVDADLSDLNDNIIFKEKYDSISLTSGGTGITKEGDRYRVEITNGVGGLGDTNDVFIKTVTSQLKFNITAVDKFGFKTSKVLTNSMVVDNEKPEVTLLGTFSCNPEMCFFKDGANTFRVTINDAGSGFDHSLVYIGTVPITGSTGNKTRMFCRNLDSEWECMSYGTTVGDFTDGHVYRLALHYHSMDDAGNPLAGITNSVVEYDSVAPVVNLEKSKILSVTNNSLTSYHTSGDTLSISVHIIDEGSGIIDRDGKWDVQINLDGILQDPTGNSSWIQADLCMKVEDNEFVCIWEKGPIVDGPLYKAEVPLKITDVAGNKNDSFAFDSFYIYGIGGSAGDNVIKQQFLQCMPSFVDRSITTYFNGGNKYWCQFNLTADGGLYIVDVQKAGRCKVSNETAEYFDPTNWEIFGNRRIPGKGVNEVALYIILGFDAQTIVSNISVFDFNCPLKVTYVKRNSYSSKIYDPETEELIWLMEVKGGNEALDDNIQKQLDKLKDDVKNDKIIGQVSGVIDTFKKICSILNGLVTTTASVLTLFGLTPVPAPYDVIFKGSAVTTDQLKDNSWLWLKQFCDLVSCKIGIWDALGGDGVNNWYEESVKLWIKSATMTSLAAATNKSTDQMVSEMQDSMATVDAYDSMIFSILMLCIPGILYNMEKARQIDCYYIMCMEKMVPAGYSPFQCMQSRGFMYCQFVIGQLFSIIPFGKFISEFSGTVLAILEDPAALAGAVFGLVCSPTWWFDLSAGWYCTKPKAVMQIASTGSSIFSQVKTWDSTKDWCDEVGIE